MFFPCRKKALVCHPDKNPDDPQATENFRHLTEALTILINPNARKSYDLKRNKNAASSSEVLPTPNMSSTTTTSQSSTANKQTADKGKQTADKSKQTADHRHRRRSSSQQHKHDNRRYDHNGLRENKYENMFNAFNTTASSSRPKSHSDIFMTEIPSELFSQKHQSDIKNYNENCVYGVFVQEIVDKADNQKKQLVYTLKSFSIGIGILIILTVLIWHHLRGWNYAEDPALTIGKLKVVDVYYFK